MRRATFPLGVLLLVLLGGCREGFSGFGAGARARAGSDGVFGAFADRHLELVRDARFEHARTRMTRGALSPSRIFDDSTVWTGASERVRLLESFGTVIDGRYRFSARPGVPAPSRLADARHVTTLSRLSDNEYRWDTAVDFAVGPARPADIALAITRLIAAGEGRTEREARAALLAGAPRTAAALGSAISLDTLRPVRLADGSTAVTAGIRIHSDRLRQRYPAFGGYVQRYVDPSRYRVLVTDRAGVPFMDIAAKDRFITIRVRTLHGRLVPLSGPARPLPDSLLFQMDLAIKVKLFTVGFHDLKMEMVNGAVGEQERFWAVTARKEPGWNLPFITARLLRAPLRRPFAGEGAHFRIGFRDGEGRRPTMLYRSARLSVQESAILNFLNSLTSKAMDDLDNAVEREEHLWTRAVFQALQEDARAALGP